jgi:hypothetical protein
MSESWSINWRSALALSWEGLARWKAGVRFKEATGIFASVLEPNLPYIQLEMEGQWKGSILSGMHYRSPGSQLNIPLNALVWNQWFCPSVLLMFSVVGFTCKETYWSCLYKEYIASCCVLFVGRECVSNSQMNHGNYCINIVWRVWSNAAVAMIPKARHTCRCYES